MRGIGDFGQCARGDGCYGVYSVANAIINMSYQSDEVVMEKFIDGQAGIPSFAPLTKISWEFYCKQEKLFV